MPPPHPRVQLDRTITPILRLKHLKPAAIGRQRYVFVHPDDPGLVIKIPTEGYVARRAGARGRRHKRWIKRYVRARHHQVFLRELHEQLALRAAGDGLPYYVQVIVGFVETDLGMGLMSRAVRGRHGELAPSLSLLAAQGRLTEGVRRHLDEFFAWFLDSPVVVGDLNAGNLVYGFDPEHGDHFVIIDGLGDKNAVPLSSISRRLNRWGKKRRIRRVKTEIARLAAKYSGHGAVGASRRDRRHLAGISARPAG